MIIITVDLAYSPKMCLQLEFKASESELNYTFPEALSIFKRSLKHMPSMGPPPRLAV